ncbi:MFS general substrate transporter [Conidiobolus coronatus NRRL 28638]|uniref:MFS general substrate transporter n=1 Tax=Conidiobolus coronatus (strain ATCC 28846 / CBS 209.66 / NRRL 28638) TaxID=796925 RepID=A0A137P344_CONC2|nr:MFS general substrate transporter [Conidiobolus coronatus NRRL 28638]|eukprot:KXN69440.1 MFS general substrate transporter [Conidiobolus coronatus NRRL 28638]
MSLSDNKLEKNIIVNEEDIITISNDFQLSDQQYKINQLELKRINRKIDLKLIPLVITSFLLSFLDRVNIGYARLYNLEADLGINQLEYSWTLSIFFIGYTMFDIPSNLMIKKWKPRLWISRIMITWGVISASSAAVYNFQGMLAARFFLGVAEAGLGPGLLFYMSCWYTRKEQAIRYSYFFAGNCLSAVIAGPLAFGVGKMDGLLGLKAWQWIFIIEGIPSIIFGFVILLSMPNSPSEAKWLTLEEKNFVLKQLRADNIESEDFNIDWKQFRESFLDYKTWLFVLLYFTLITPYHCMTQLLPTIIKSMGYSNQDTMLLTIPPYTLATIANILNSWHSDYKSERCFHQIFPLFLATSGYIILISVVDQTSKYIGACITVVGVLASFPIALAWFNNTLVGNTKSAISIAIVLCCANIGGAISGQMYTNAEAPKYFISNLICLSMIFINILISLILRFYLKRENSKLAHVELQSNTNVSNKFRYII